MSGAVIGVIIFCIILILSAIGGGIYYYVSSSEKPKPEEEEPAPAPAPRDIYIAGVPMAPLGGSGAGTGGSGQQSTVAADKAAADKVADDKAALDALSAADKATKAFTEATKALNFATAAKEAETLARTAANAAIAKTAADNAQTAANNAKMSADIAKVAADGVKGSLDVALIAKAAQDANNAAISATNAQLSADNAAVVADAKKKVEDKSLSDSQKATFASQEATRAAGFETAAKTAETAAKSATTAAAAQTEADKAKAAADSAEIAAGNAKDVNESVKTSSLDATVRTNTQRFADNAALSATNARAAANSAATAATAKKATEDAAAQAVADARALQEAKYPAVKKIIIYGNGYNILNLAEIKVFDISATPVNIIGTSTITAEPSVGGENTVDKLIDNNDTTFVEVNKNISNNIAITFPASVKISKIEIINRTDTTQPFVSNRTMNNVMLLLDDTGLIISQYYLSRKKLQVYNFAELNSSTPYDKDKVFPTITKIEIVKPKNDYPMNIAEAIIFDEFGNDISSNLRVSLTPADNIGHNLPPSNVIDKNNATYYHSKDKEQITLTLSVIPPKKISKLTLVARQDCCSDRMIGVQVKFYKSDSSVSSNVILDGNPVQNILLQKEAPDSTFAPSVIRSNRKYLYYPRLNGGTDSTTTATPTDMESIDSMMTACDLLSATTGKTCDGFDTDYKFKESLPNGLNKLTYNRNYTASQGIYVAENNASGLRPGIIAYRHGFPQPETPYPFYYGDYMDTTGAVDGLGQNQLTGIIIPNGVNTTLLDVGTDQNHSSNALTLYGPYAENLGTVNNKNWNDITNSIIVKRRDDF